MGLGSTVRCWLEEKIVSAGWIFRTAEQVPSSPHNELGPY